MPLSHRRLRAPERRAHLRVETLEARTVPSAVAEPFFSRGLLLPNGAPGPVGLTPAEIRTAYGFNAVTFGSVTGDGSGQTIAIIDAYDNPKFVSSTSASFLSSDLHNFDATFGLPDPPTFTKVNQSGGSAYPAQDTGWGTEIALDVEWAHAVAPGANIVLVEANSASYTDLMAAASWAKNQPGVSAVSMSFGGSEWSGETGYDSVFTTPSGHQGVTFLASTGDNGAPGGFPAYSPRVVAVGGTHLNLGSGGTYSSESGWSGSGGGVSTVEAKPAFQSAITLGTRRMIPDVSLDADPNSGVAVYDSFSQGSSAPWIAVGGTSFSAPAWAGLIAIANQGRVLAGEGTLDGASQTLPKLYSLSSSDFHDVTTGSNGHSAGVGYDLVTGLGTPIAPLVAHDLIDLTSPPPPPSPPPPSPPPPPPPVPGTYSYSAGGLPAPIRDYTTTVSTITVPSDFVISKLTVTLNIAHTYDSDLVIQLVSPAGRVITLANRRGGSGDNYSVTTFDSTASLSIAYGTAPFNGTYAPEGSLKTFNTLDAKGTWQLRVSDVAAYDTGTLKSWSLTITGVPGAASPAMVGGSTALAVPSVGPGQKIADLVALFAPESASLPIAAAPAPETATPTPAAVAAAITSSPATTPIAASPSEYLPVSPHSDPFDSDWSAVYVG
jgi:subtilisin-like proprotein convertase family protein